VAKITSEPVLYAYDAWSSPDSQQAIYDMLAPNGSFATVLAKAVKEVDGKNIAVHQVFGSVHKPEHRKLGVSLFAALEGLLADGAIKVNICADDAATCANVQFLYSRTPWRSCRTVLRASLMALLAWPRTRLVVKSSSRNRRKQRETFRLVTSVDCCTRM
jgi:hypothetical protein